MRKWVKWALIILIVVVIITIVVAAICVRYRRPEMGNASIDEYYRPQADLPHPTAVNEYWHLVGFDSSGPLILDADRYEARFTTMDRSTKLPLIEPEPDMDLALMTKGKDTWIQRLVEDNGWAMHFGEQTHFPISHVTLSETRGPCFVGPLGYIEVGRHRTANVSHLMMSEGQESGEQRVWFLLHGWVTNSSYISSQFPPHRMKSSRLTYYYFMPDQSDDGTLDHVAIISVICRKTGTGILIYQKKDGGRTELNDIVYNRGTFTSSSSGTNDGITTKCQPLRRGVKYGTYTLNAHGAAGTGRVVAITTNILGSHNN